MRGSGTACESYSETASKKVYQIACENACLNTMFLEYHVLWFVGLVNHRLAVITTDLSPAIVTDGSLEILRA